MLYTDYLGKGINIAVLVAISTQVEYHIVEQGHILLRFIPKIRIRSFIENKYDNVNAVFVLFL